MCSARSSTGFTVTWVSGLPHHWPDLLGGDRGEDLLDPGQVGGPAGRRSAAGDRVGGDVGVQHHLPARHPRPLRRSRPRPGCPLASTPRAESWARARSPSACERRTFSDSVDPSARQLGGARGHRGVEVEGVGQVQVALDVHRPVAGHLGQVDVEPAGVRGACRSASVGLGVEPGLGLLRPAASAAPGRSCAPPAPRGCRRTPRRPATGTWWPPRSSPAATPAADRPAASSSSPGSR